MARSPQCRPFPANTDPYPCWATIPGSVRHPSRIATRRCGADGCATGPGPSAKRGADEIRRRRLGRTGSDLLAAELRRVVDTYGNEARSTAGPTAGPARAGFTTRSVGTRFLKMLGGYTFSRHSTVLGCHRGDHAAGGGHHDDLFKRSTQWTVIAEHTDLLGVLRRGQPRRTPGSITAAPPIIRRAPRLNRFRDKGGEIVLDQPLRSDVDGDASGCRPRPGPMSRSCWRLAHVLATEGTGRPGLPRHLLHRLRPFRAYLLGTDDGVPKSPQWAAPICGRTPTP